VSLSFLTGIANKRPHTASYQGINITYITEEYGQLSFLIVVGTFIDRVICSLLNFSDN
jgi:hypothetical protein